MKIPNKEKLQQIAFSHSSDIDFKDFMNLYKKCTEEPYSFFHATLASDNSLRLERTFQKEYKNNQDKL